MTDERERRASWIPGRVSPAPFSCSFCRTGYRTEGAFDAHVASDAHQKRLMAVESENRNLSCETVESGGVPGNLSSSAFGQRDHEIGRSMLLDRHTHDPAERQDTSVRPTEFDSLFQDWPGSLASVTDVTDENGAIWGDLLCSLPSRALVRRLREQRGKSRVEPWCPLCMSHIGCRGAHPRRSLGATDRVDTVAPILGTTGDASTTASALEGLQLGCGKEDSHRNSSGLRVSLRAAERRARALDFATLGTMEITSHNKSAPRPRVLVSEVDALDIRSQPQQQWQRDSRHHRPSTAPDSNTSGVRSATSGSSDKKVRAKVSTRREPVSAGPGEAEQRWKTALILLELQKKLNRAKRKRESQARRSLAGSRVTWDALLTNLQPGAAPARETHSAPRDH